MATNPRFDRCFNPFNLTNHLKTKNLRKANAFIQEQLNMYGTYFLCIDCKKKVYSDAKQVELNVDQNSNTNTEENVDNDNNDGEDILNDQSCSFSLGNASQRTDLLQSFGNENDYLLADVLSFHLFL